MDGVVNSIFRFLFPSKISLKNEKLLKNIALLLGLLSAIAIIFDWYPITMFLSFFILFDLDLLRLVTNRTSIKMG